MGTEDSTQNGSEEENQVDPDSGIKCEVHELIDLQIEMLVSGTRHRIFLIAVLART